MKLLDFRGAKISYFVSESAVVGERGKKMRGCSKMVRLNTLEIGNYD